jgi:uncharacterized protein (TIGR02597 family)
MIHRVKILALIGTLSLTLSFDRAQAVTGITSPVGFVSLTTLSNSDTIFSTPLAQPAVYQGSVSTLSSTTVTAGGTPGWTTNGFVYVAGTQSNTYYLRFLTGAQAGSYYTVTANTANTLTLNLAGGLLTGAAPGDQFAVIPYWTLGTVFPASAAGTAFKASTLFIRNTQIFFPNQTSEGINFAAAAIYYYTNSAWQQAGSPSGTSANDTVLPPDSYVTIRNPAGFTGSITVMGEVVTTPQSTPLNSYATTAQDNAVAITYPVNLTLNNLGLAAAFVPSSIFVTNDQLLTYDNTVTGINKSASAIYYYMNGAWRESGQNSSTDFGTNPIQIGSGFIVRKAINSSGPLTTDWIFTP